ncbi:MAG: hypothetical protein ACOC04_03365 [Halothece sp.]
MATVNGKKRAVNDLEYDLLTVLQSKSEALKAYDIYIEDAEEANAQSCVELFQKLQQQEIEQAQEIRRHLQQVMSK